MTRPAIAEPTSLLRPHAAPVTDRGRIAELDVMRGAALVGVMWMNVYAIEDWLVPATLRDHRATAPLDHWVGFLSDWLVGGKAQTLFGILFGFGFAVFTERATARDDDASRRYARRLLFLLVLGLVHYVFVWWGDILHDYAVVGALLIATRRWSSPALAGIAFVLLVPAPPLLHALLVSEPALHPIRTHFHAVMGEAIHAGDFPAMVGAIGTRTMAMYGAGNAVPYAALLAGQFCLGAWLHRGGWLQHADTNRRLIDRVCLLTLPTGLILASLSPLHDAWPAFMPIDAGALDQLGTTLLAIGWGSLAVVACRHRALQPVLGALGAFGRMALTNYVAQSLFFLAVTDGFGLDLAWRAGLAVNVAVALAAVVLQVVASRWWLKRFLFGPLEWLWRSATYQAWQPFRRRPG